MCQGISMKTLTLAPPVQGIIGFTYFYCTSASEMWPWRANSRKCFYWPVPVGNRWDWKYSSSVEIHTGTRGCMRAKTSDSALVQPSWGMFTKIILLPPYPNSNLCVHLLCLENWMPFEAQYLAGSFSNIEHIQLVSIHYSCTKTMKCNRSSSGNIPVCQ